MWWRINKWIFLVLALIFAITSMTRNSYRDVDNIDSRVIRQPIQLETANENDITVKIGDFRYRLEPLYYYEISGMIVNKKDYSWLSIHKRNKALPVDLCMIWGGNVANKVYRDKNLKFSQGFRFCNYSWRGDIDFNRNEASNNHLLIADDIVNKKVKWLTKGDQIKITGLLVNIYAKNTRPSMYDPDYMHFKTSTTRTDTGAGACEVIYVANIEVLKRANPFSNFLFWTSLYLIVLVFLINIGRFIYYLARPVKDLTLLHFIFYLLMRYKCTV